jgi:hypothetical protein
MLRINCVCCVRHSLRRPSSLTHFSSSTFKEDYRPCNDDYAILLRTLFSDYDEIRPICKCNCRSKMRHYSRIIPETASLSQDASDIQLDAPDIPPSDILPSPSAVDITRIEPYIQLPPLNIPQPQPTPDIPQPTSDIPQPDEELHNLAFNDLFANISL